MVGIAFGCLRFPFQSLVLSPSRPPLVPNRAPTPSAINPLQLVCQAAEFKFESSGSLRLCPRTRARHPRSRRSIRAGARGRARALTHAKFRQVHVALKPLQVAGGAAHAPAHPPPLILPSLPLLPPQSALVGSRRSSTREIQPRGLSPIENPRELAGTREIQPRGLSPARPSPCPGLRPRPPSPAPRSRGPPPFGRGWAGSVPSATRGPSHPLSEVPPGTSNLPPTRFPVTHFPLGSGCPPGARR